MSAFEVRPIGRVESSLAARADAPRLRVSGLEAIDGTPVVDLKPVIGALDER